MLWLTDGFGGGSKRRQRSWSQCPDRPPGVGRCRRAAAAGGT